MPLAAPHLYHVNCWDAVEVKHGYTNRTDLEGTTVRKVYDGPDSQERQSRELRALEVLRDRFPVPRIAGTGQGWLATDHVPGPHGQDLIEGGHAGAVLAECGRVLRQLHSLDPRLMDPTAQGDVVIRHGDFGPNNALFQEDGQHIAAIVDWEFSGVGEAITDIAWCEWIVRMHHPGTVDELPAFFDAYGATPPWVDRHEQMVRRCRELQQFATRWDPAGPGITAWRRRTKIVESWNE